MFAMVRYDPGKVEPTRVREERAERGEVYERGNSDADHRANACDVQQRERTGRRPLHDARRHGWVGGCVCGWVVGCAGGRLGGRLDLGPMNLLCFTKITCVSF